MKVFLSWSGEPSRRVAEQLRRYLHLMIQSVEPFMSKRDIASGVRWASELAKELEHTDFGIVCLEPNNLEAPWLLFEAGALAKHVKEGRVCCLLLRGLTMVQVTGPLEQFQNRQFAKEDLWHLFSDLNRQLDRRLEEGDLKAIFEKWWPDLEAEVMAALADPELDHPVDRKRDASDLLEELLLRVRSVEHHLQHTVKINLDDPFRRPHAFETTVFASKIEKLVPTLMPLLMEFLDENRDRRLVRLSDLEGTYSSTDIDTLLSSGLLEEVVRGHDEKNCIVTMNSAASCALKHHLNMSDLLS